MDKLLINLEIFYFTYGFFLYRIFVVISKNMFFFVFLGCPKGTHGSYCSEECDCVNGGICNGATGQCKCPTGFIGDQCEKSMYL